MSENAFFESIARNSIAECARIENQLRSLMIFFRLSGALFCPILCSCMSTLFFVRHGETDWNIENKICGVSESNLTENGVSQAIALGKLLKSQAEQNLVHIDLILYSPLVRGKKTAQCISAETGIPMQEEPALIERNFGFYEGCPRNSEQFARDIQSFAQSFGRERGGESNLRTAQRIYNLLDCLTHGENRGKTFLLVGHNGLARIVNSYFYDMTNEEFAGFRITNCQLLRYDF